MSAILILVISFALLIVGYFTYGSWCAKQWGLDDAVVTPAHELEDGNDYVPAKAPVLLGHHFSSIAGAGPINGPIQAAVFGWVPVLLWIIIGGIFFGAVQDFSAIFASIRHKGQSIGSVIETNIGQRAKRLFLAFSYLTLLLVVAAFASIVAGTFNGFNAEGATNLVNGQTATISILFIVIAIIFGFLVYRKNAPLGVSTIIGVVAICVIIWLGRTFPIYMKQNTWMILLGVYIMVASVTPVWILLQPRDYLSSFLLYGMMILAVIGVFGSNPTMNLPAFTGFKSMTNQPLFPVLFITVACGAISGFHSLVGSGTTAKQLNKESDAKLIGYGGMLIECGLAVIALLAVGYLFEKGGSTMPEGTPTVVFAGGLSKMIGTFAPGAESITYQLLILAVSAFCLTSLDTATRLARYMFQEFFVKEGEKVEDLTGIRKTLANPYVATVITVIIGIGMGMGGYAKIWPLFGAANQLLAGLALLAAAAWLGNIGKNNKMFLFPMVFMLIATITSLVITIIGKFQAIVGGTGDLAAYLQLVIALVLIVLAVILAKEGFETLKNKKKMAA
ncbi:MAG: carbon starvation protein A [Clostridia bacterium]|nr:carbon starvation protein A [Clostridia bacterium]